MSKIETTDGKTSEVAHKPATQIDKKKRVCLAYDVARFTILVFTAWTQISDQVYAATISADFARFGAGPYWLNNSVWNRGSLVNGKDYKQTITFNPTILNKDVTISWSWPSTAAPFNVYSYPGLFYGTYGDVAPSTSIKPKEIGSIDELVVSHDVSISGQMDEFNVIYDFFTSNTAGGTNYVREVEILVHTPSLFLTYIRGLSPRHTYSDPGGMTWTVATSTQSPPQIFFMPSAGQDILSKTSIDVKAMFAWAISKGLMSRAEYFNGLAIGAEPRKSNGTLKINTLEVTYK